MTTVPFTTADINATFIRIVQLHTPKAKPPPTDGESVVVVNEHNPKSGKKPPEFPSRRAVGELIFGALSREHVVDFYLSAVANFPRFEQAHPYYRNWSLKSEWTILHIFIQSFFTWVLDNRQRRRKRQAPKKYDAAKSADDAGQRQASESGASDEQHGAPMDVSDANESLMTVADESSAFYASCTAMVNGDGEAWKAAADASENEPLVKIPVKFSAPQKNLVVRQLIGMRFPPAVRIWSTVLDGLSLSGSERIAEFVAVVQEMMAVVSFGTINYCLTTPLIATYFHDPTIVVYALLLGPLKGAVVEAFTASRNASFRATTKKLLLEAEICSKNPQQYAATVRKYAQKNPNVLPFSNFTSNTFQLMRELRHDELLDNQIPWGWAHSAVKRAAKRYYVDKTWRLEHLNDLFLTVITQRPPMKQSIVQLLQNVYNDDAYADRIRRLKYHTKFEAMKMATYAELHFEFPGYMGLPFDVNVFIVDNSRKLEVLEADLVGCEQSDFPVVGLDSEWSSYVAHSKASVLQISFEKAVYLVDLDAFKKQKRLCTFIERLFRSKRILKIGFQFNEDLIQLRECARDCKSLYEPENLICIGKLIGALLSKSSELGFDSAPYFVPSEEPEVSGENAKESDEEKKDEANHLENGVDEVTVEDEQKDLDIDMNVSMAVEATPNTAGERVDDENIAYNNNNNNVISDTNVVYPKKVTKKSAKSKKNKANKQESDGFAESIRRMGLSALCQHVFQKCLDKTEQCSVWDRRPLRPGQVRYAALDAYVIVELYKHCQKWASNMGVDLAEIQQQQDTIRCNMPLFYEQN